VYSKYSRSLTFLISKFLQGDDVQELREEGLEFALKRLWSICALNLYRQATYAEPPDSGMGAAAQKEIASKLSAPLTTAPWLRRLVSSGCTHTHSLTHTLTHTHIDDDRKRRASDPLSPRAQYLPKHSTISLNCEPKP